MKTTPTVTIVTIKWGSRYPMAMVNRLAKAVKTHGLADARIICFTDDSDGADEEIECRSLPEIDLPEKYRWTFWRKIALYNPELGLQGACLYFDLDVIIVGDLRPLLSGWDGEPRFIKNWVGKKTQQKERYDRINSSVVLFPGSQCGEVYEKFGSKRDHILESYPGDQGFTYDCLEERASFFRDGLCVSFKKHCLPKFPLNLVRPPHLPDDASVIIFHGHPDPDEARTGYRGGSIRRWSLPVPWLHD